jgi:hypothetical protein
MSFRNLDSPPTGAAAPNLAGLASLLGAVVMWLGKVRDVTNNIMRGKTNNGNSATLTASSATTTLQDPLIGGSSKLFFTARTANAAAVASSLYYDAPGNQTVTLHHGVSANLDMTFDYIVVG